MSYRRIAQSLREAESRRAPARMRTNDRWGSGGKKCNNKRMSYCSCALVLVRFYPQVVERVNMLKQVSAEQRQAEKQILIIIEHVSAVWRNDRLFEETMCMGRNLCMNVIIIERRVRDLSLVVRENVDMMVLARTLDASNSRKAWEEYFCCYESHALFEAAHARERAHRANLVWVNAGAYEDVEHSVFSLAAAPRSTRDTFALEPAHQMRKVYDMSTEERDEMLTSLTTGRDVHIAEQQALFLFRVSHSPLESFALTRHAPALAKYAAWLACAHAELLAISHTSCGHFPRVLCDFVMEYS
jgi:hypothetical protein